ncbi:MAG: MoxR family ATPase [Acidimicrobiia bacterium]|nr:MoxR family ATPase [Acidimicrobiia bacterium]
MTSPTDSLTPHAVDLTDGDVTRAAELASRVAANLDTVIKGKHDTVRLVTVALVAGGHVLIEDVPGVGKTLLAKALARTVDGSFRRIQATSDVLPTEITGVSVYHESSEDWSFRPGPIFADIVLVDEINRATPRTQSALLEAMEERQVSVDGVTRPLPHTFTLLATQNPVEHVGTFPLVEGQRDRFLTVASLGYPDHDSARALLLGSGGTRSLDCLRPVLSADELAWVRTAADAVFVDPRVADYILEIVERTRRHADVALGVSPRGALATLQAARAHALMEGRPFIAPADVKAIAAGVLSHRLLLHGGPDLELATAIVHGLLLDVAVPRP